MRAGGAILPFEDWPQADREMWRRATRQGGLFDDVGPLADLAAETLGMIRTGYGKWLGWIAEAQPAAPALEPAERLTPERLVAFAGAFPHLSPKTLHLYAFNTLRLLHMCHPERDWSTIQRVVAHLRRQADAYVSHRKDGRILASSRLLDAGLDLAGASAEAAESPFRRALGQRNGTLIAFLALIPLRRRAFTSLRLGSSVVFDGADILIVTTPEMTKTKTHWETLVPARIAPVLRQYIGETRPRLMARSRTHHDVLWVTKNGDPITGSAMGTLIRNQTRALFGIDLSLHLFRDSAATTLARISPAAVGHLRPLLGHRGHQTAETYYNHATALEVGRTHGQLLDSIRQGD